MRTSILLWILTPSLAVWKALLEKEHKIFFACVWQQLQIFPFGTSHAHKSISTDPQTGENISHDNRFNKHLGTEESGQVRVAPCEDMHPFYTQSFHLRHNWPSKQWAQMQHPWTSGWIQSLWTLLQRNSCCPGGAFILLNVRGVHKWGSCYCRRKGLHLPALTIESCPFRSIGSRFSSHRWSTQTGCQSNPGLRGRDLLEMTS